MWIQALDLCVFDLGDFARLRSVFNLFFIFFGGGGILPDMTGFHWNRVYKNSLGSFSVGRLK